MPKEPPFDEKTGRPNFPATIFNDSEMYKMKKAFFFLNYAMRSGMLTMEHYKPQPPFGKDGKPTFPTHRLSGEEFEAGREMWKRVSPDGRMPDKAPFTERG